MKRNKILQDQPLRSADKAGQSGWQASLVLEFTAQANRTALTRNRHDGPLLVQRPFFPEADGSCHIYILHPPGGIVGGDTLALDISGNPDSRALVTSPAATKFYRSAGPIARQIQSIEVYERACVEWLPQETIVYSGALAENRTRIQLYGSGVFMGWEITCLGRPAAAELFEQGQFNLGFELYSEEHPIYLDKSRYTGSGDILSAAWGLQGQPVNAIFVCAGGATAAEGPALINSIRETVRCNPADRFSATQIEGALVCRYLGGSVQQARTLLTACWALARKALLGKDACPPRIWNT